MSADLLRQLLALDLSTEQALAVMDIIENRDGDRKEKARARWHKWNDKRLPNVSKREPTLANVSKPTHASATEENKQTNKKENKKGRATRLTTDWQTPDEWIDEAVAAGLTRAEALTEANRMKNWSVSTTGAVKLDWHATWQNWFLRFLETRGSQRTHPPPPAKGVVGAAQRMMEKSNGSESIFGSGGNGKLISAEPNDESGRSVEYLQGSLGRRYLPGNH